MGILAWITITVIAFVVIGVSVLLLFFSGLIRGSQIIVLQNPTAQNVTQETKQFLPQEKETRAKNISSSTNNNSKANVLVITTDKVAYNAGEPVRIAIENIGRGKLRFPDSALGLEIRNIDIGEKYPLAAAQVITVLGPGQSKVIIWNQDNPARPGHYTVTIHTTQLSDFVSAQTSFVIK